MVRYPADVPVLVDPDLGLTLRAHGAGDLAGILEQARDPQTQRWSTEPVPPRGFGAGEAADYLRRVEQGWLSGRQYRWAVDASAAGGPRFAGTAGLQLDPAAVGEVSFGLHPAARGKGLASSALRLVREHAFDTLGLRVLRWRSPVGDWACRRTAAAAGFRFDGRVRRLVLHRGQLSDGWLATLTAEDPRISLAWTDPPTLTGDGLRCRPFTESDASRIVEACGDERTQHWLVSLPTPYGPVDALGFVEATREETAQGHGWTWCVVDADDRCLGSVSLGGFGGYARRCEIGYWAHPAARGRGVTTAAVRLVTGYAEQHGLVDSIVVRCAAGNSASRHVAEAAGYGLAGVLSAAEPLSDGTLDDLVTYARPAAST